MHIKFFTALLLFLFTTQVQATACHQSESLQQQVQAQQPRQALQALEKCLQTAEVITPEDNALFNQLFKALLTQYDVPFDQSYQNLQTAFAVRPLNQLLIQWQKDISSTLFKSKKAEEESFYFYYDTGRFQSEARGIALTDHALIWENFLDSPQRLAFDHIEDIRLQHSNGISLTSWQLQFNEQHELRLSQLTDEQIIPFVSALIYFINFNKTSSDEFIDLHIPLREKSLLAGGMTTCHTELQFDAQQAGVILENLNTCLANLQEFEVSVEDQNLLTKLIESILQQPQVELEEGYRRFKAILNTYGFSDLAFQFQFSATDIQPFSEQMSKVEKLYFYHDTGRFFSDSRGVALTDHAVIWKNIWGEPQRINFPQIGSVKLLFERGLSFSGWKLRLNQHENYDIRLSQLSASNVKLFSQAIVYFINISRQYLTARAPIILHISPETQLYLTTSFYERHAEEIQAMAVVAVKVAIQVLLEVGLAAL